MIAGKVMYILTELCPTRQIFQEPTWTGASAGLSWLEGKLLTGLVKGLIGG